MIKVLFGGVRDGAFHRRKAMNNRRRLKLVSLIAALGLSMMPAMAVAGWRVLPTTGFVTEASQILLIHTIGGLWIRSEQNLDRLFVYQGVPLAEGDVIDAIVVCYRAEPGTRITAIGLVEFVGVGGSTGTPGRGHFDGTVLNSPSDTCYVSPVADYAPFGAVNLWLEPRFPEARDPTEVKTVFVGAVFVHVK
jgi:hypothetical protein